MLGAISAPPPRDALLPPFPRGPTKTSGTAGQGVPEHPCAPERQETTPVGRCVSSPRHLLAGSPSPCLSYRLLIAPAERNRPGTASGVAECWAGHRALAGQALATAAGKAWHRGDRSWGPPQQNSQWGERPGAPGGFWSAQIKRTEAGRGHPGAPPAAAWDEAHAAPLHSALSPAARRRGEDL